MMFRGLNNRKRKFWRLLAGRKEETIIRNMGEA
jgi:hypothetical protein